ncbi:GTP-binding protein [Candidatus Woesearchaeota archaeon]|jgi:nucleolar GTP-binding protein|nr:GTP-binding protein [Candidatus Woesearchaeota archaeon]MBT4111274.1 GTP-binding protein [Candidatus Woesearchaeota archaeon]MBT4335815.1 GTP-binding protein [Candidatus Woesearchaeota archaeon]MBT4469207.1 GTP-binding protein [Candidatus Woesearchaeota archaeon]MBT6744372.1 GTP-binding protein [Candidatus Woesearchaeota archaeon]
MNFQNIAPVETSTAILDLAFGKARQKGKMKKLKGNWLQIIRQKEGLKLDVVKNTIVTRLDKSLKSFPSTKDLSEFYTKLMKLTLDYPNYKKSLGAVNWAIEKTRLLHKKYVSKVVKTKGRDDIKELSKQFYGRISSILKQIDSNLVYLDQCRKIMKDYPDIKEMFTICVYGFPNVGKTTLLNKITGTKAEVAAYAFTTKSVNAGYFKINDKKVQVLDVPGTLARKEKMNDIEFVAELVLKEVADIVIYVFDLSEYCGFSVKKQMQLYKTLGNKKEILIYLSKLENKETQEALGDFDLKYYSADEIKEKIGSLIPEIIEVSEETEDSEKKAVPKVSSD